MNSSELIELAKSSFLELKHKDLEWRSFYHGFVEAVAKIIEKRIIGNDEMDKSK